jgi:septin 6/8/11
LDIFCRTVYGGSFTPHSKFQAKINEELQANGVQVYHFPTDDETVQDINTSMNSHVPFAVVGSTEFVKLGSKMIRARQYPWGIVQGKNF